MIPGGSMEHLGLSLAILSGAMLVLPFLNPKDERARAALFGLCILLSWRYLWWRFDETLPPLALTFDSLYAWAFSTAEAIAIVGWTISFVTLSRFKDRSPEATGQTAWLEGLPSWPRVDVLITTYNEEEAILTRTIVGALGIDFPAVRVWVLDDGRRPWRKCSAIQRVPITWLGATTPMPRPATSTTRSNTFGPSLSRRSLSRFSTPTSCRSAISCGARCRSSMMRA